MFKIFSQLLGDDSRFLNQYLTKAVIYGVLSGLTITVLIPVVFYTLKGEVSSAVIWLILLLIGVIACWKLRQLTELAGIKVGESILRNARHRIGDHVASLPIGWFNPDNTARLSHIISKGMIEVAQLPAHLITPVVSGSIAPLVLVIALLILHPLLGMVALVSLPIIVSVLLLASRLGEKADQDFNERSAHTSQRIVEFAQAQSVLRAFSSEGSSTRFLERAIDDQQKSSEQLIVMTTLSIIMGSWVVQTVFAALLCIAIVWLNDLLVTGVHPTEIVAVVVALILVTRFIDPMQDVANYGEALRSAKGHLNAVREIFMIQPLPEPMVEKEPKGNNVTLNQVSFAYEKNEPLVLNQISLEIESGSMVALIGASGSGKTTLARLIARFFDVTEGEVMIGGVNVKNMTEKTLTDTISQIFQDSYLFQGSVRENILMGKPDASEKELQSVLVQSGLQSVIESLPNGLDTLVGEGGAKLSGGERQRIAIARALIKDAPILLVDEATAALDAENQAVIAETLERLRGSKTLIVIAHQLSTIQMADQIVVLENGSIKELGSHETLINKEGEYSHFIAQRQRAKGWRIV
ncbi:ABC transporter ATP-binding protein [Wohlfahrtiimonas larvae]|uniref:ABC transporter ATP-binding protein n=1 Tax=Wohlfahrtiimonas larvae TaxID=1157986 RepID=A0ABP9MRQ6_9GAMM|nr:ABC transporter ATP-binding protein [Wohlfahrtiimonas larvae]